MSWISSLTQRLRPQAWASSRKGTGSQAVTAEYNPLETPDLSEVRLRTLGTFGGVFTPSFLTIIGVIMYLRFSWVVGNAGLYQTLLIVGLANIITFITALSVSSIASNERMETGGAYFMVSRVLGYQAGGGIGIPLYLSQSLSIALYVIGFAESLHNVMPQWPEGIISFITLALLSIVALFGANFMVRIQYFILAIILGSFVSIGFGFIPGSPVLTPDYLPGQSFWTVFAVFFPAVTGLLSGVSMSGDLKNPAKSIPRGTLLSVAAGFVVYMLVPIMLAFSVDRAGLYSSSALSNASRWPALVTAGVFGATLSSAIGSLMAAPRTLQALGIDGVLPSFLGKGVGKRSEPLAALGISLGLAFGILFLGDLNLVAEVLTMFFLTTYGVLNFSAAMEHLVDNPSYRPALRVPWIVNFLGFLGCLGVMFLISPLSTLIALGLVLGIFIFLSKKEAAPLAQSGLWEGFWTSLFFAVSRRLEESRSGSGKNWRPMVQVFAGDPAAHAELVRTATYLTLRGGSLSAYALVEPRRRDELETVRTQMKSVVQSVRLQSGQANTFVTVVATSNINEGVLVASQAAGFGAGLHNTVMIGLPSPGWGDGDYTKTLKNLMFINRNIILFQKGKIPWTENRGRIQVWWGGQETNVRLMLLLAYLLQNNCDDHRPISLATIVPDQEHEATARKRLEETFSELRIAGETRIIINPDSRPIPDIIRDQSAEASLVFLGMAKVNDENSKGYLDQLRKVAGPLGATMFVMHNILDLDYV